MNIAFWLFMVYAAWFVGASVFFGTFLLFRTRDLSEQEVANRINDGRMFRDILIPFWAIKPWQVPGMFLAALLLPWTPAVYRVFVRIRKRVNRGTRYKTRYQEI